MTERNNSPFCESTCPFSLHGVLFVIGSLFHTLANVTERESNSFSIACKCSFSFRKKKPHFRTLTNMKGQKPNSFSLKKTPFRSLDSPFREKESFSRKGLLFAIQTQRFFSTDVESINFDHHLRYLGRYILSDILSEITFTAMRHIELYCPK